MMTFLIIVKMDLSQFSPNIENATFLLQIVETLHKLEVNAHTKAQNPFEFKMTKAN